MRRRLPASTGTTAAAAKEEEEVAAAPNLPPLRLPPAVLRRRRTMSSALLTEEAAQRNRDKDTRESGRELHGDKGEGSLRMLRTETKAGELLRELRTIAPGWGRAGRGGVEKTNQIHPNSFYWWGAY